MDGTACVTPSCSKKGTLVCPTCKKLGIPPAMSTFCSQECFKGYWSTHKALHKMFTQMVAEEQAKGDSDSMFEGFEFTGKLRPGKVSPMQTVPEHIARPDYWQTGQPVSEQQADNRIPVYTKEQIEGIREACHAGRQVLDIAAKALRVGVTGDEIDRVCHDACIELGCYPSPLNYYNFPKSLCISVNEVICHGIPDSRELEDGDIVNLDISVFKDGYHGDLNETYLLGKVDDEGVRLVKTAFECLQTAVDMVKPGTMYRELGKQISAVASAQNFSVVKTYCGHGIGSLFHCAPNVPHYAKNKAVGIMKPGNIFTIEPMINVGSWRDKTWPDDWTAVTVDGLRSAQFEHTLLVTEDGYEILTAREDEPKMVWDISKVQRPLLHRAIYCCSQELCLGQDTDKYVVYFVERVQALVQNGITPYVVFDGGPLPMKKATEDDRRASNRELGLQYYRQRNYTEARKCFSRAADVSPYMAHRVIQRLKAMGVQYVVAPYEADAQLAFLVQAGLVDGVITEDSDCLPFGCGKVLFKMDRDGVAQEVQTANLKHNKELRFHMFTDDMFLEMCIFSGCDYLASLPGFGLKKAYALVKQHGSYRKIIRALRLEGKVRVPETYEAEFERAKLTFRHQRVYDPKQQRIVSLSSIPAAVTEKFGDEMPFLGPLLADDIAQAIAEGDMDPITLTRFAPTAEPSFVPRSAAKSMTVTTGKNNHKSTPVKSPVRVNTAPEGRQLPSWAARKASPQKALFREPRPPSHFFRRSSASPVTPSSVAKAAHGNPGPSASAPGTISRFFAALPKPTVPADDQDNQYVPATPPESQSFESQDSVAVDVARSISFSPVDDEAKQTHLPDNKENTTPNRETACASAAANRGDNAFARMMKAGSVLQRHSLKRKASSRSVGVLGAAVKPSGPDAIRLIKRLAFTAAPASTRPAPAAMMSSPLPAANPLDAHSEEDVEEPEAEDDLEEHESTDADSQTRNNQQETLPTAHGAGVKSRLVVAPVQNAATKSKVSFARFRYSQVK
ncbi:hypothetical protein ATCC90586_009302 [Pythium insidiosum]|nr:hypothetical protein ATCC90586_009302 [Pythium insidiosum]